MCYRTREINENKVETVLWDTLYVPVPNLTLSLGFTVIVLNCSNCILL